LFQKKFKPDVIKLQLNIILKQASSFTHYGFLAHAMIVYLQYTEIMFGN